MKLSEALLCVECDEVFAARENPTGRCPVCGSSVAFPVERALLGRHQRQVTRTGRERCPVVVTACREAV